VPATGKPPAEVEPLKQALVLLLMVVGLGSTARAQANLHTVPLNLDPTVRQGFEHFYNLDYDGAYRIFQGVAQQHPSDPMAYNYLLFTVIFRELYHQDLLDTTYYARNNFLTTKRDINVPQGTRQQIEDLTNKVVAMCDATLKSNPKDTNALFERGYAKGMHGAFAVLVDHAYSLGARQGLAARNDSEAALKLDPQYADADMAVGIQQFAVASLPGFLRMVVGIFGVGGNKPKGLEMLRTAAEHGVVTSVESRTALSLFLRHDGRYPEALVVQRQLAQEFPHDYLFRLEVANLTKDEGHGLEAIALYRQVIEDAQRPGYFTDPRLQQAWFGMADTQRGYNMIRDAAYGYTQAATQPNCSDWLRKRAWLSAGQMEDLLHNRQGAIADYNKVLAPGGDQTQASAAREYLKTPYVGK
jgi:tetratricopeptide (TPR) repeat protein